MKTCTYCNESLDESCFYRELRGANGLCAQCKACVKKKNDVYRKTAAGKASEYRRNHSPAAIARKAKYAATDKRKAASKRYDQGEKRYPVYRRSELKRKYGMTIEQFDEMLESQGGACAICGQEETHVSLGRVMPLSVDHDHDTGAIRELLCSRCNKMLGMAGDRCELLFAAIGYLRKHANKAIEKSA